MSRAIIPPAPAGGVLVVLPPSARDRAPVPPRAPVAGLPLLRRIVLAGSRAGFARVLVGAPADEDRQVLAGTSAEILGVDGSVPVGSARRVVLLPMNVIPQPAWLGRLLKMPIEPDRLYVDGGAVAVVEARDCQPVVAVASRCGSAAETVTALRRMFETVEHPLHDEGDRFAVSTPGDLPGAEIWLLQSLIKPSEGIMSRFLERRISLALTRRLCLTSITPNTMTLVSLGIGLGGAPFFLSSAPAGQLAGALLFLTHSILDGCDGEIARLKFLESRRGALLDFVGDNLVHVGVFACMAVGWALALGAAWPLLLGGIAVASTAGSAAVVYHRGLRASTEGSRASALGRLADALAHRDFIYLIVLLAAVGRAQWFLVVTAAGAPVYLVLLAWLGRRRRPASAHDGDS